MRPPPNASSRAAGSPCARRIATSARADGVDVIIDATGNPNVGAEVALATIAAGKHMVMMNVEADVTIGAYLSAKADEAGVVYTLGAGDEPSSTMELVNFLRGARLSDRRRRQGQEQRVQASTRRRTPTSTKRPGAT